MTHFILTTQYFNPVIISLVFFNFLHNTSIRLIHFSTQTLINLHKLITRDAIQKTLFHFNPVIYPGRYLQKQQKTRIIRGDIEKKKGCPKTASPSANKSDKLQPVSRKGTVRCRSLLKLNCIINASRTISDGLYGNLRRRASVEIRKGITTPCHRPWKPPTTLNLFPLPVTTSRAKGFIQLIL